MNATLIQQCKTGIILILLFSFITGLLYPTVVTGIAQLIFPWQANGSLLKNNGKIIGSELIGQYFSDPNYFWSRPSATTPYPYNASLSTGSNLGPSNPDFLKQVKSRMLLLSNRDPQNHYSIPIDLVTSSASGLDPEISPNAAYYQANRIANKRKISIVRIQTLILSSTKYRTLGILGEPRVNVLELNLALDQMH